MFTNKRNNNNRFMKDIIFDNLPSLNINLTKNKFLKASLQCQQTYPTLINLALDANDCNGRT